MPWDRANELEERIARFDAVIAGFERTREELIARLRDAAAHLVPELEEQQAAIARTVEPLRRSRDLAVEDLKRQKGPAGSRVHTAMRRDR